jgi:hypothetical protein
VPLSTMKFWSLQKFANHRNIRIIWRTLFMEKKKCWQLSIYFKLENSQQWEILWNSDVLHYNSLLYLLFSVTAETA